MGPGMVQILVSVVMFLKCFGKEKLSEFNFLTQVNLFLEVTIEESICLYTMFYAYSFHIT